MSESVFQRVEKLLRDHGVVFDVLRHEPVYTSEQAAAVRGTPLASGAKALICKADGRFVMFVLPADRRLASKAIRRSRGWRKLRFAGGEEVQRLTGLEPGSIPPFGSLFDLPTLCDSRLGKNETINFNAGDHCISVSMTYMDYVQVEHPELGSNIRYPGGPYRLSMTPWAIRRKAPMVGEHNLEIFNGELGITPNELSALAAARVI